MLVVEQCDDALGPGGGVLREFANRFGAEHRVFGGELRQQIGIGAGLQRPARNSAHDQPGHGERLADSRSIHKRQILLPVARRPRAYCLVAGAAAAGAAAAGAGAAAGAAAGGVAAAVLASPAGVAAGAGAAGFAAFGRLAFK